MAAAEPDGDAGLNALDHQIRIFAPAKLTLSLRIDGVRADGYHLLTSEMVSIDLADELVIDPDGEGLEIEWDHPAMASHHGASSLEGAHNLVTRALAAVDRVAGVRLLKRIPVGGGLGGGSTDAGAILRWAGVDDLELAARLGGDVPFCVTGGRAQVSGIGEIVEPRPFVARVFALALPPFGVNTAAVYQAWDEWKNSGKRDADPVNGLTAAALVVEPRLALWREALADRTGLEPTLAGSGSTWFVEVTAAPVAFGVAEVIEVANQRGLLIAAKSVPRGWNGALSD